MSLRTSLITLVDTNFRQARFGCSHSLRTVPILYHLNLTGAAKSRKKTEKQSFNLNPALLFIRKKGKEILGIMQALALTLIVYSRLIHKRAGYTSILWINRLYLLRGKQRKYGYHSNYS